MDDKILTKNIIDKIKKGKHTKFLNLRELNLVIPHLKKEKLKYDVYFPYRNADKAIIYYGYLPDITCFEIDTNATLKHSDILGSIFALSIEIENFGSIIVDNDKYYIIVLSSIANYVKYNLINIGKCNVSLNEVDIKIIENYENNYIELNLTVSSERIDNVIASITGFSRAKTTLLMKEKNILLNYNILLNNSYTIKENDVFSIRKFGKYKYIGIIKITKSDKLIIKILKYD